MSRRNDLPAISYVPARTRQRVLVSLAVLTSLVLLFLSGCITRTLENDGLERVPAPVDSAATGNMVVSSQARSDGLRIVRFENTGSVTDRAARRVQADHRMAATCGDVYRVSAEGSTATSGIVHASTGRAQDRPSAFWYIQFSCVQNTPAGGAN